MATHFIADLHLQTEEPAITAGFLRFLRGEARGSEGLYILGDLFEAWIGDDDPTPLHAEIAREIRALVASGTPCYFIHGNRDFLLGRRFARESGMQLLAQEKVLDLYGRRVLIMHGDTLCTDDVQYQAFRRKVHTPWIQALFLALPLFIRRKIARRMRSGSRAAKRPQIRSHYGRQSAGGNRGDGKAPGAVADPRAYSSSAGARADG
ncbi:UDP-2,3-diacylglucosamine hydrolase [Pluralibacter gergoviae]|nr:UDP-2,3-diacylglucosamine hydrolase [Pluralibacter gergoviae]